MQLVLVILKFSEKETIFQRVKPLVWNIAFPISLASSCLLKLSSPGKKAAILSFSASKKSLDAHFPFCVISWSFLCLLFWDFFYSGAISFTPTLIFFPLYSCYLTYLRSVVWKYPLSLDKLLSLNTRNFFRVVICQNSTQEVKAARLLFINENGVSTCVERFENYP